MRKTKSLSGVLYELANEVIKRIEDSISNNEMKIVKYPYLQAKILDYHYEKGSGGYATSFEETVKKRWDERKRYDFVDRIKKIETYVKTVKIVVENYNIAEKQADFWLDRFVNRIVTESLNKINQENLIELISIFISDLEHTPKQWNPIIWLDGIYMDTDVLEINKNIRIKKPEAADLEYEIPYDVKPIMSQDLYSRMPSAIMLIQHRAKDQPEMQYRLQSIIATLSLYKVGSIIATKTEWNPSSILEFTGIHRSLKYGGHFKYDLGEDDENILKKFFKTMEPLINSQIIKKINKEETYITIAFDRYNDALIKDTTLESRITSAMMCLEALYLGDDFQELARRLSQRVSRAMSYFGYSPLKVYKIVKKSYRLRSIYVHGSRIDKEERKKFVKLENEVMNYARLSINLFLQLDGIIKKDVFLSKLDSSLLDETAKNTLNDMLKQNCQF